VTRPGLLVLALLAAAVLAGCGATSAARIERPPPTTSKFEGGVVTPPRKAQPIALHDAWGRPVTLASERGKYVLVTFLYVHCPDVCPLIAQNLNATLQQLGPKRSQVRVLAVSVDPNGDTPAAVKRYVAQRQLLPQFRYLVGTRAELSKVWAAWHVLSVRSKPGVVDHVAYTSLVDPSGRQRLLYGASVKAGQVLHDLRVLMSSA
jgi:protein SCO1/2